MRVLLVLAVAFTLVPTAGAWTRLPQAEAVASEIAGRPVEVRCVGEEEWPRSAMPDSYAYTWFHDDGTAAYVALSPMTCWSLLLLGYDPANQMFLATHSNFNAKAVWQQGQAVLTLAHEAVHMTGVRDEGVTECRALNYIDQVLARYGVPAERRASMHENAMSSHRALPPAYRTVC